jgi:hypothetical protein
VAVALAFDLAAEADFRAVPEVDLVLRVLLAFMKASLLTVQSNDARVR